MEPSPGQLWTMLPHGRFRVRVLAALIQHQWFIRLRWVFVALALLLLAIELGTVPAALRPLAIWIAVGALALVNLLWMGIGRQLRSHLLPSASDPEQRGLSVEQRLTVEQRGSLLSPGSASEPYDRAPEEFIRRAVVFVNGQMVVDIFLLTVILRYSGGIENPMAIFYIFHMLIAALLLKPLNALMQGVWALVLFAGLGIGECMEWITPHYAFLLVGESPVRHTDWVYVISAVGVLAAGIAGTLYFTVQISSRLDEQEDELFRANQALHRSQEALERHQERRSRFMQTAAHQLKSPVTGIETLAMLIRDGVVGPDGVADIVGRIIKRCRDAIVQVTELLTLARVEELPTHRHDSVVASPKEVLDRLVARFGEQARGKGVSFESDIAGVRGALVAIERRDLEDCVGNLLDNAIKYTPEGGQVVLAASFEPGSIGGPSSMNRSSVRISVRDTGIGIAAESLDSIFEPFHRGNEALASSIGGSGLGLTIVRAVVEHAEGTIEVRSEPGQGSEFAVTLPASSDRHAAC